MLARSLIGAITFLNETKGEQSLGLENLLRSSTTKYKDRSLA